MDKGSKKQIKKSINVPKTKGRKFLTAKVVWGYAIGQLGWALLAGLMASIITKVWVGWESSNVVKTTWSGYLGTFAETWGAVFGITKLVDAFAAPIIGKWSDKTNTKWGRRLPFMAIGIFPMALVTVFAFFAIGNPTQTQTIINLVILFFLFILFYISLNAYVIPFTALINDLSKSSEDRVKLTTANAIMYLLGTVLAFSAPMLWGMLNKMLGGGTIMAQTAIVLSIVILTMFSVGFMIIPLFVVKEKKWVKISHDHSKDEKMTKSISSILKDKQFKIVLLLDFFLWFGLIGFNTLVIFVVSDILGLPTDKAIYFSGVTAVVALMSYGPIAKLMNKVGVRKNMVMVAFALFIGVFLFGSMAMLFTKQTGGTLAWIEGMIIVGVVAIPNAIMGVVKNVILSDIIETNSVVKNEDKSGAYYAVRNMTSKIAMAFGMIFSGTLIGIVEKGLAMRIIFGIGVVMFIFGAITLHFYKEVKYRYNREFFKFIEAEKEEIELKGKLKTSTEQKDIDKYKKLIIESKEDQVKYLKISTEKIEYETTKAINEIKFKISKIENCKKGKCLKCSEEKKKEKIYLFNSDIKAYNIIRTGMSLKALK